MSQDPSDYYVDSLYQKFKFYATWPANAPIALGQVGVFEGRYFKQLTSLEQLGMEALIPPHSSSETDYSHSSRVEVGFSSHAKGKAEQLGKVDVNLKFESSGAFLFEAAGCVVTEITNKQALGEEIKKRYREKTWEPYWVLVDRLITAKSTTVMVSHTTNSELQLSVATVMPSITLTDARLDFQTKFKSGELTKIIAKHALSPLFQISRVKHSFLDRLLSRNNQARFGGPVSDTHFTEDVWERIIQPTP